MQAQATAAVPASAAAAPASTPVSTQVATPAIGQMQSSDVMVHGAVELTSAGARVMSGAQLTAGTHSATLKLTRGGEVRFCPGAAATVTSSRSGNELMFGLNSGALETHYQLAGGADALVTPDFRLLLAGPGAFDFAVSVGEHGETCVASLKGNNSSAIVYELMGEGTYQVHPGEQVLFKNGVVSGAVKPLEDCGCPAPPEPAAKTQLAFPEEQSRMAAAAVAEGKAPPQPPVRNNVSAGETHIEVESPMVFRAADPSSEASLAPPAPSAQQLREAKVTLPEFPNPNVQPPAKAKKNSAGEKRHWYQRLFSFLKGNPKRD